MNNKIPIVCVCAKRAGLEQTSDAQALRCTNSHCIHSSEDHQFLIHQGIPIIISDILCDTICSAAPGSTYIERPMTKFARIRKIIEGENKITKENINLP